MNKKLRTLIIIWIIPILLLIFDMLLFSSGKLAGVLLGAVFLVITGFVSLIALIISIVYLIKKKKN